MKQTYYASFPQFSYIRVQIQQNADGYKTRMAQKNNYRITVGVPSILTPSLTLYRAPGHWDVDLVVSGRPEEVTTSQVKPVLWDFTLLHSLCVMWEDPWCPHNTKDWQALRLKCNCLNLPHPPQKNTLKTQLACNLITFESNWRVAEKAFI